MSFCRHTHTHFSCIECISLLAGCLVSVVCRLLCCCRMWRCMKRSAFYHRELLFFLLLLQKTTFLSDVVFRATSAELDFFFSSQRQPTHSSSSPNSFLKIASLCSCQNRKDKETVFFFSWLEFDQSRSSVFISTPATEQQLQTHLSFSSSTKLLSIIVIHLLDLITSHFHTLLS